MFYRALGTNTLSCFLLFSMQGSASKRIGLLTSGVGKALPETTRATSPPTPLFDFPNAPLIHRLPPSPKPLVEFADLVRFSEERRLSRLAYSGTVPAVGRLVIPQRKTPKRHHLPLHLLKTLFSKRLDSSRSSAARLGLK